MGIRNLRNRLEPYSEQTELKGRSFVIDGPSLAFHIARICGNHKKAYSPWAAPTYQVLGDTTLAWLDQLRACGNQVSSIFFDGALPEAKEPIRIGRLSQSTRYLQSYASANKIPPFEQGIRPAEAPTDLFTHHVFRRMTDVPPTPAFLVPAVLEALRSSARYAPVTKVVPDEADPYCAAYAKARGETVLTSDSDLLVNNLGPRGTVVFFDDLEIRADAPKRLTAREFSSAGIRKKCAVREENELLGAMFKLREDPDMTLNQALQLAKKDVPRNTLGPGFEEFAWHYIRPGLRELNVREDLLLDPRISEFVLRWSSTLAGPKPLNGQPELHIFLPFLLDDLSRTSAWACSQPIRSIAYSILNVFSAERPFDVQEFRRQFAKAVGGTSLEVYNDMWLDQEATHLVNTITKIRQGISHPDNVWSILSIHLDIVVTAVQGKSRPLSLEVLSRSSILQASWEYVHFCAQVQGTYYSLRILQQMYDYVASKYGNDKMPDSVKELRECVSSLPPITGFPTLSTFISVTDMMRKSGGLDSLLAVSGLPSGTTQLIDAVLNPVPVKKTPAKKRKSDADLATEPPKRPINMFELLSEE